MPLSPRLSISLLLLAQALDAAGTPPSLTIRISSETVPPGATAQFKISLSTPAAILAGRIVMDFDPAVFGEIAAAAVHSATGDAYGVVNLEGRHLDARFTSIAAGIARLPDLPVLTVSIPVLSTTARGTKSVVTLTPGTAPWKDADGVDYSVAVNPGQLTVGGALSIDNVTPGGGLLPAGTRVRIDGTGFTPATTVEVEGVGLSTVTVAGPKEIGLTLAAPADLTGKRIRLRNPDGAQAEYVSALRGDIQGRSAVAKLTGVRPIFPRQAYLAASVAGAIALENPNPEPVDVRIRFQGFRNTLLGQTNVTIPTGGFYLRAPSELVTPAFPSTVIVTATLPIRMLGIAYESPGPVFAIPVSPFDPGVALPALLVSSAFLSWDRQVGSGPGPPQPLGVCSLIEPVSFRVSVETASGGPWLSVTPDEATTFTTFRPPCAGDTLAVSADTSALAEGTYRGTITLTPLSPDAGPVSVDVSVTVTATLALTTSTGRLFFSLEAGRPDPSPQPLQIMSNGNPAGFSVTTATTSGGNWLSVDRDSATTPATLMVTATPGTLGVGDYEGVITIRGAGTTLTVSVLFNIHAPPKLDLSPFPAALAFSAQAGGAVPNPQILSVNPFFQPISFSTEADAGGKWLTVAAGPVTWTASVGVNPAGLPAGTYRGTVTLSSAQSTGPVRIPVTLTVWLGRPPPLSVSPASLAFTLDGGGDLRKQTLTVESGGIPLEFSVAATSDANWLSTTRPLPPDAVLLTPGTVEITAYAPGLLPGLYPGKVTITALGGSVDVPATLQVSGRITMRPYGAPLAAALVNAASGRRGAVAPGEIVTIYGFPLGPLDAQGKVATQLGGARVLFDGAPAPLLYASVNQLNAVVPDTVAGRPATLVEVEYQGARSPAWGVPVASAAPGVFAVLNQDGSLNGAGNPAARGSVIQIYGTGGGAPLLPVRVSIGGADALVGYAGPAPQSVPGLLQINATVPSDAATGSSLPLVVTIGGVRSQDGISLMVK